MDKTMDVKDGNEIPQFCTVCERTSFLRCVECNVSYCSGACQIKNWQEHRMIHLNMHKNDITDKEKNHPVAVNPVNLREHREESGKERLMKALTKTADSISKPTQNIANTQSWRSKDVEMKSDFSEDMDTADSPAAKLIRVESKAMAKMSPGMRELEQTIKQVSGKNNVEHMEVILDDIAQILDGIKISEHPFATEGVAINQHLERPMISIHKYDRIAPIPPSAKDFDGFFMVEVTAIVSLLHSIYSVVLNESKDEIELFKHMLNVTYNDDLNNPTIRFTRADLTKHSKSLLLVKFDEQWARCRLQQGDENSYILVDIDTGKTSKLDGFLCVKKALEPEKMKSALSFKVKFENYHDKVAVGDCLKIRLINSNIYGVSTAMVQLQNTEVKTETKIPKEVAVESCEWDEEKEPIFMISRILVKSLPKSGKLKLSYVDGSRLEDQGKMCVYESTLENKLYYHQLYKDIQAYIAPRLDKNNYKPVIGELVLATFSDDSDDDGSVYRAVCVAVSPIDCKVHFIDFGNTALMPLSNIWKMPEQFVKEVICVSVEVRLISGKPLKNINLYDTLDSFATIESFDASIEHFGANKYAITIDDALIIFKT